MRNPAGAAAISLPAPSAKEKNAVRRSVTTLLDELAPERVLKRGERLSGPIEQHRTPTGCVLQAADSAISVSWFADGDDDSRLGALHVTVWHGTVTRLGTPPTGRGATVIGEHVLRPVCPPAGICIWEGSDGTRYDAPALAAKCLALLEEQSGGRETT